MKFNILILIKKLITPYLSLAILITEFQNQQFIKRFAIVIAYILI